MADESVTAPENVSVLTEEVVSPKAEKAEEPIADQTIRIHVKKLPEENKETQGSGLGMMLKSLGKLADGCSIL